MKIKMSEGRLLSLTASIFMFLAGLTIILDPTPYTPYQDAVLYILMAISILLMGITFTKGGKK